MQHVSAGFLGGLASSVLLQPLDLLKTRVQQNSSANVIEVLKSLKSVKEAWRGTLPSVIRTSCGAGLYFGVLNFLRTQRASASQKNAFRTSVLPKLGVWDNIITGASARALAGFIMMPITVIKVRYESSLYSYKSINEAFKDIISSPLGWRGLFAGFGATVTRDAPYAGIYMVLYDISKSFLQTEYISAPVANSMAAINAAILASTATAPFDTVKTRVQISNKRLSYGQAWNQIVSSGWRTLFDGLNLRLFRKAISTGISWCIYEEIVRYTAAGTKTATPNS